MLSFDKFDLAPKIHSICEVTQKLLGSYSFGQCKLQNCLAQKALNGRNSTESVGGRDHVDKVEWREPNSNGDSSPSTDQEKKKKRRKEGRKGPLERMRKSRRQTSSSLKFFLDLNFSLKSTRVFEFIILLGFILHKSWIKSGSKAATGA